MIPRHLRITLLLLMAWALLVVFFLPGMRARIARLSRPGAPGTEEQARREVIRPALEASAGPKTKARIYWAGPGGQGVEAVEIELPLSAEPAERAKQLLDALIGQPPAPERRTLPQDTAVLEVYVLADGTAVLDFSASIGASLPSGIHSERLAVDSITRTLAANVEAIRRARILMQGQEAETLAGHVDLTGFLEVRPPQRGAPATLPGEKSAEQKPERKSPGSGKAGGTEI
jgi:hypothetical protein